MQDLFKAGVLEAFAASFPMRLKLEHGFDEFMCKQIASVSSGYRGVQLHDNAVILIDGLNPVTREEAVAPADRWGSIAAFADSALML